MDKVIRAAVGAFVALCAAALLIVSPDAQVRTVGSQPLPSGCTNGQVPAYNTTTLKWDCASDAAGSGTVTSVAATVPTGLSISGSPVTTNGTLAFSLTSGYAIPGGGVSGQVYKSNGASAPGFAGASTVGGLILVEKKTITGDVTDVTFSGLDGDTDQVYMIIGRTIVPGAAGSAYDLTWQPNALATDQTAQRFYADTTTVGASTYSNLHIQAANSGGVAHSFQLTIHAAKVINGVATRRTYFALWQSRQGSDATNVLGGSAGQWNETSTNITSLVIHISTASKIGNGSTYALYKYAQS